MDSRTQCPWTNTVCRVVFSSLARFLAVSLMEPQRSLIPCAGGVLNDVLDVFAEVSFCRCPYNFLNVAPAGGVLDGVSPFSSVMLGF